MFAQAQHAVGPSFNYLSAREDKHQGCSSSSKTPGEQSPQQGLGHRAVAFQHGARPGQTHIQTYASDLVLSRKD